MVAEQHGQRQYPTSTTSCSSSSSCKSVRFARGTDLRHYQEGPKKLTFKMMQELWFQPEEFEEFKASARLSSLYATKKGLSLYIKHTYGYTDDRTQSMLNLWTRCSDTRRGLERFINKDYAKTRIHVRQKTVGAVLFAQGRMCNEGIYEYSQTSEMIRHISTTLTAESIAFALMLGKADVAAVVQLRTAIVRRMASPSAVPATSGSSSSSTPPSAASSAPERRSRTSWSPPAPPPPQTSTPATTNSGYEIPIGSRCQKQHRRQVVSNRDDEEDTIPTCPHAKSNRGNRPTRSSRERQDQLNLLERANLGRREISFIQS